MSKRILNLSNHTMLIPIVLFSLTIGCDRGAEKRRQGAAAKENAEMREGIRIAGEQGKLLKTQAGELSDILDAYTTSIEGLSKSAENVILGLKSVAGRTETKRL